ncbi:NAD(P)/FAD-dependent oxidoreductase [Chromobacterium sp. CV08]|uniref:NAD(P)/FAD-dependent oxidoreductase n=1 Tax=Chromobacterium sp. CV08 TaxID=3133274 RepID=UPI003DA801B9
MQPFTPKPERHFAFIDQLYDYGAFLESAEAGIGRLPAEAAGARIGIVGAGISGLVAAYELLRAGASDVTLLEAEPGRIGGRAYTKAFCAEQPRFVAELGAMRFPPSEVGMFHYLRRFGIATSSVFPDPGVVDTEIHYRGRGYAWAANQSPPALFQRVHRGWCAFLDEGAELDNGVRLAAPHRLTALLADGRYEEARGEWQRYLDSCGDLSFYSALVRIFCGERPPGGERWCKPDDFQLFGSLGIGSGGFQPVFRASFIEIMRLVVNALETDQRLIPEGISALSGRLAAEVFDGQSVGERVRHARVNGVTREGGAIRVQLDDGGALDFDRLIVTCTNRSMQVNLKLSQGGHWFDADVRRAINETHLVGSSKLFILTPRKFWLDHGLPHNIQTDTLVKGVYCLDYQPDDPDGWGVVLISYTWEDDSHKLLALAGKAARCRRLVEDLAVCNPEFARHLRPLNDDYERHVQEYDWISDPNALGAFKLNYPGEDGYSRDLFFQFQSAGRADDCGVYLAGCGSSFTGGWVEGAVQTGINSACAVIRSCGGELAAGNPLDEMRCRYDYR